MKKPVKYTNDEIEVVAMCCHQMNAMFCEALNDLSQSPWHEAPDNIKASAIDGVRFIIDRPEAGPEAQHESWRRFKTDDGWVYGNEKDAKKKTHPCMVPYERLPREDQLKDELFYVVARANLKRVKAQHAVINSENDEQINNDRGDATHERT